MALLAHRSLMKTTAHVSTIRYCKPIGKKHIPGSKEGMYMITEAAYTPFTYPTEIDGKKAYETRGKGSYISLIEKGSL